MLHDFTGFSGERSLSSRIPAENDQTFPKRKASQTPFGTGWVNSHPAESQFKNKQPRSFSSKEQCLHFDIFLMQVSFNVKRLAKNKQDDIFVFLKALPAKPNKLAKINICRELQTNVVGQSECFHNPSTAGVVWRSRLAAYSELS